MRILDLIRKMNYEEREAGLYSEKGRLRIPWDELQKKKMVCTKGKVLYAGYNSYQMEGGLVIPKTVEYIEFLAFHSCYGLTEVYMQDGVKRIGSEAFRDCDNLTKVHIPYSTTYIGEQAFAGCVRLQEVKLKEGMKYIDTQAFDGCLELCRIEIPETIVSIGACAFCQCAKLVHIFYKGTEYTEKDAIIYRLQHDDVMINHSAFAS